MKHWKRIIPICLLTLVLVIGITLLTPKAAAATESDLTFTLSINGNSYTVSDCKRSASGDMIIPTTYNGKPVTSIGNYAFSGCTSLTSITIPDSVTFISNWAFYGCSRLKGVYITDLAAWCNINFSEYDSNPLEFAGKLYLNGELVTDLIIPDSVTTIGDSAFCGCSSLTSVIIPDSITSIGVSAFIRCHRLTSITIPDSVTIIDNAAFYDCSSLESITIPDSVATIGVNAFENCSRLQNVYYAGTQNQWNGISIGSYNDYLIEATIYYNWVDAVSGDFTGDNAVNNDDVVLLLWHTLFPEDYPLEVNADLTGDGQVNNDDVVLLLWHTLFPEDYPI